MFIFNKRKTEILHFLLEEFDQSTALSLTSFYDKNCDETGSSGIIVIHLNEFNKLISHEDFKAFYITLVQIEKQAEVECRDDFNDGLVDWYFKQKSNIIKEAVSRNALPIEIIDSDSKSYFFELPRVDLPIYEID